MIQPTRTTELPDIASDRQVSDNSDWGNQVRDARNGRTSKVKAMTTEGRSEALRVRGLTKTYGDRRVVNDVSFELERGEVFGFLGPNGSGKTTTMRMALDLIKPDSGSISVLGSAPNRGVLRRVGYLPEERGLFQRRTTWKILWNSHIGSIDSRYVCFAIDSNFLCSPESGALFGKSCQSRFDCIWYRLFISNIACDDGRHD